jgi:hypothetical protein
MTRAEDLRAIRRHDSRLAHMLGQREWKGLRRPYARTHGDETVRLMREALDATERHTRGSPQGLGQQFQSLLHNQHFTSEDIARVLSPVVAMAKSGHYPGHLVEALNEGVSVRALDVKRLPEHAEVLRPIVEKAGSLSTYGVRGYLLHGIGRGLITQQNVERALDIYRKHMEALATAGHSPEKFEKALELGARSLKDIDEIDKLAEHARRVWQKNRQWEPAELFAHALEANEQIKDLDETLKLQREMLAKGIFPTKTLTLRYWKARPR